MRWPRPRHEEGRTRTAGESLTRKREVVNVGAGKNYCLLGALVLFTINFVIAFSVANTP